MIQAVENPVTMDRKLQLREAAQQLVASTFIKPLMEQMRSDPFKSDLFHGGFTEDAFGAQLDTILADRITQRMNLPMVDAVYRRIAGQAGLDTAGLQLDLNG